MKYSRVVDATAVTCFGLLRLGCLLYDQELLPLVEGHNAVAVEIELFEFGKVFLWIVRTDSIRDGRVRTDSIRVG